MSEKCPQNESNDSVSGMRCKLNVPISGVEEQKVFGTVGILQHNLYVYRRSHCLCMVTAASLVVQNRLP